MKKSSAFVGIFALMFCLEGEASMDKVELSTLQGESANTAGEYYMHLRTAVDLLNLAAERNVIDVETFNGFVYDFRNARNARDMMQTYQVLTRLLYREAVDYSDILYRHGVIDFKNYRLLKENLGKGSEFTKRDLEDADHLDSVAARAASGLEDPGAAGKQILDGLRQMELRRKQ